MDKDSQQKILQKAKSAGGMIRGLTKMLTGGDGGVRALDAADVSSALDRLIHALQDGLDLSAGRKPILPYAKVAVSGARSYTVPDDDLIGKQVRTFSVYSKDRYLIHERSPDTYQDTKKEVE